MFTSTAGSPFARMTSLDPATVSLGDGFWRQVHRRSVEVTVPSMAQLLFDPEVGHAYQNFRIASGDEEGDHAGPPFMDGDFYKWLEAATLAVAETGDPGLEAQVEAGVAAICAAQRADGYLHTQTQIRRRQEGAGEALDDRLNFETYNLGHLMTAGCVRARVTGRRDLLQAGIRAADYLRRLVAERPDLIARSAICPSHYMGVIELYRTTGAAAYLQLAQDLLELRDRVHGGDDNQDRVPLRDQRVAAGHAVRANYLYAGVADVALEAGDEELRPLLERLWADVVDTKLHLTGGCGALYDGASPDGAPEQSQITRVHQAYGRAYQLPNTTAHNETCAAIGMLLWSWRMLLLTGQARYADLIETILYNGLLAAIGVDAKSYFYTNPLRQVRELPYPLRRPGDTAIDPVPAPPASDARLRQEWMSCFCCPPNIARTLTELPYLAYATGPDGVWVHQFLESEIRVPWEGQEILLRQHTDYPASGLIRLAVSTSSPTSFTLRVRIPAWAEGAVVTVGGEPAERREDGYAVVERVWSAGDEVVVELPLRVRKMVGHRLAEEVANQVALLRGPVVYCLESPELPAGVSVERIAVPRTAPVVETELPTEWGPWPGLGLRGLRTPAPASPDALYAELPAADPQPIELVLIPYAFWGNRGASEMSVWLNLAW